MDALHYIIKAEQLLKRAHKARDPLTRDLLQELARAYLLISDLLLENGNEGPAETPSSQRETQH